MTARTGSERPAFSETARELERAIGSETDTELERALVSSLLVDPTQIPEASAIVAPDNLSDMRLRPVLEVLVDRSARGEPIDLPLVTAELEDRGKLKAAGGVAEVSDVFDFEATGANALHYARQVKRHALERERAILHARISIGDDEIAERRLAYVERELEGDAWPAPVPLEGREVRDFPIAALPDWLADFVKAEAEATQTPPDLPAMLSLATLGAAIAGKARVRINTGYAEPLNLYVAVALDPGNLKSPVFSDVTDPLYRREIARAEEMQPRIAEEMESLEILRGRREKARKDAISGKASGEEAKSLAREIREAEASMPKPPRLVTDDVTPEKLAHLLHEQSGRIALLSSEGGELFEIARGRYSGNARPNLGVLLRAWSGDALVVDRKSGSFSVENPALSIGVAIQPSVIEGLREARSFRDSGLLARFLWSIPRSRLGSRDFRTAPPVPHAIREPYRYRVAELEKIDASDVEREIALSAEARDAYLAFRHELETQIGEEGRLAWIADWASKIPGQVVRIAGILHTADYTDAAFVEVIPGITMQHAIAIGRYLISHAEAAFGAMHADPALPGAKKIWRFVCGWSERQGGVATISRREIWQGTKSGIFKTIDDLDAPLRLLEASDYLALEPPPAASRRRGKPTILYRLNPRALLAGGSGGSSAEI